jgi:hypothetical protein
LEKGPPGSLVSPRRPIVSYFFFFFAAFFFAK